MPTNKIPGTPATSTQGSWDFGKQALLNCGSLDAPQLNFDSCSPFILCARKRHRCHRSCDLSTPRGFTRKMSWVPRPIVCRSQHARISCPTNKIPGTPQHAGSWDFGKQALLNCGVWMHRSSALIHLGARKCHQCHRSCDLSTARGFESPAGRAQWISGPSPWPLGHTVVETEKLAGCQYP